jgi:hypothetical protein
MKIMTKAEGLFMRDIGGLGESTFKAWCNSVGLSANESHVDKTGWDYLVEFPINRDNSVPVDLIPPAIECKIQVKSTDKCRGKVDISLKNMERLVKSLLPTFICIFEFDGKDSPERAFLVHIGEKIIRRTLSRLRKQKTAPHKKTSKSSLSIRYDEGAKLPATNGACLMQAIEECVPHGMQNYHQWKEQLINSLGYESGHGYITLSISGHDPITDLIDLSLGLRKSIKVSNISIYDSRFGVDRLTRYSDIAKLSLGPAIVKGSLRFRERTASPGLEFLADVHNPSVNRVVPRERITFKIDTKFFELLVEPFSNKVKLRILPNFTQLLSSLSELNDFLSLLCMLSASGKEGILMEISVDNRIFLPAGKIISGGITAPKGETATVREALELAQKYEIDRKISVSLDDIFESRKAIHVFHFIVTNRHEKITCTFSTDTHLCIKEPSGVVFKPYLKMGGYILYCIFGLTGYLEPVDNNQYGFISHGNCCHRGSAETTNLKAANSEMDALTDMIKGQLQGKGIKQIICLDYSKVFH